MTDFCKVKRVSPTAALAEHFRGIYAAEMAVHLQRSGVDLNDREAVERVLRHKGWPAVAVYELYGRAVAKAREITA